MMNKRDAKRHALTVAISLIDQEIGNPTFLTGYDYGMESGVLQGYDQQKVTDQLEIIRDQLLVKLQAFAEEMP